MLLVIDIGNTNIHLGVFRGEKLVANWDIANVYQRTSDDYGLVLTQLLEGKGVHRGGVKGVAVACVVPPVCPIIDKAIRSYFSLDPFFIGPETASELLRHFDEPDEVGADRIANAVGGYHKYGGPLIVVDFGTATTFDAVSADGEYLGGAIAPGINISIDALFRQAARLPRIELLRPSSAVGRNTVSSMQSGIIFGYAGLIEALVRRIRGEIGESAEVVATGGLAGLIVRETGIVHREDEHLTLEGLRILYHRFFPLTLDG